MIDTHSHLLPGLDHGCPDLQTSIAMARRAWEAGTRTVVCTPHLYDWDPDLVERARGTIVRVREALLREGVGLQLLLGFEVDLSVAAEADTETLDLLVMEGSAGDDGSKGTLLLETPFSGWPPFLEETIFRLTTTGYLPVLAHPERNERIARTPDLLSSCLRAGAVAQGTAGSMSGGFRRSSMRTFLELLDRGDLTLLASDGHAQVDYTWSLAPLLQELRKRASHDHLERLVDQNAQRVLAGKNTAPQVPLRPSKSGWSQWGRRGRS